MIFLWSTFGSSTNGCTSLCALSTSVATHRSASTTRLAPLATAASASSSLRRRSAAASSSETRAALAAASSATAGEKRGHALPSLQPGAAGGGRERRKGQLLPLPRPHLLLPIFHLGHRARDPARPEGDRRGQEGQQGLGVPSRRNSARGRSPKRGALHRVEQKGEGEGAHR